MLSFHRGRYGIIATAGAVLTVGALVCTGCPARHESISGYYQLQVNPAPDAPPTKVSQTNMLFGMDRLSFSDDHTYRFGPVSGEWQRSGSKVTLVPKTLPKTQPYADTTMADSLTVLLQRAEFTTSPDEKTLTAVSAPKGAIVFQKKRDGLR